MIANSHIECLHIQWNNLEKIGAGAGDTILVSSPEVNSPHSVRYGWKANPKVNLYNKAGLPAIPFITDGW